MGNNLGLVSDDKLGERIPLSVFLSFFFFLLICSFFLSLDLHINFL